MVNCSKLTKNPCADNPKHCKLIKGTGFRSFQKQSIAKKSPKKSISPKSKSPANKSKEPGVENIQNDISKTRKENKKKSQMMTSQNVEGDVVVPVVLDIFNLRQKRQNENNRLASISIKNRKLTKDVNVDEYKRVLDELINIGKNENDLLDLCNSNDIALTILSGRIAINASRQGAKDEQIQIEVCNETTSKFGISITNLSATAYRPTKSGEILNSKTLKSSKICKNDCLKSFDAKISGKVEGWVFAKVVIGNGGHQDNVFEEAYNFCDWVVQYGTPPKIYVLLIDTNLESTFVELKQKYKNIEHLVIGNHIEVQQYFIDNYGSSSDNK